jgi:hypothetical protein
MVVSAPQPSHKEDTMPTQWTWPVAALAVLAVSTAVQAGPTLDRVTQTGVLRMSTDPQYPPQSSLNAENEFEGFDIEVGTEIARRLGVEVEFVTPSWDVITADRWAGRWDISVGSMTPTEAGLPRRARGEHLDQTSRRCVGQAGRRWPGNHVRKLPQQVSQDRRGGRPAVLVRHRRRDRPDLRDRPAGAGRPPPRRRRPA